MSCCVCTHRTLTGIHTCRVVFVCAGNHPVHSQVPSQHQHDQEVHRDAHRQAVLGESADEPRRIQICSLGFHDPVQVWLNPCVCACMCCAYPLTIFSRTNYAGPCRAQTRQTGSCTFDDKEFPPPTHTPSLPHPPKFPLFQLVPLSHNFSLQRYFIAVINFITCREWDYWESF